ncbi:hypothetical protein NEOLI_001006 [Neolecta irregularis DAH-3]|uniref:Uncharacterized protein n=1 Tax=Neolecta irregularis (strain DAH-3) TaxID=1198029 RepID=A0A1U7LW76_NEOID|nr:hypothetical protein NEOLI_001006 [Neolecta irregularis DAH-3]|eukprot:OLL26823.1 hypothetical protein NEOLI_001006 [Neolecta irregularis DAH-3]
MVDLLLSRLDDVCVRLSEVWDTEYLPRCSNGSRLQFSLPSPTYTFSPRNRYTVYGDTKLPGAVSNEKQPSIFPFLVCQMSTRDTQPKVDIDSDLYLAMSKMLHIFASVGIFSLRVFGLLCKGSKFSIYTGRLSTLNPRASLSTRYRTEIQLIFQINITEKEHPKSLEKFHFVNSEVLERFRMLCNILWAILHEGKKRIYEAIDTRIKDIT